MQDFSEIRVRSFNRWGVTVYETDGRSASSRLVGEFDSVKTANEVASALKAVNPDYLLNLMAEEGKEPVGVYYAYDSETADRLMNAMFKK